MAEPLILQLSGSESGSIEIQSSHTSSGERRHAFQPPFSPAAVNGLFKVLEKYDLIRCELSEDEQAALNKLGVFQREQLVAPEVCHQRIGQKLYEALFPLDPRDDHNICGALQNALNSLRQGEVLPLQLRFYSSAVDLASLPWEMLHDGTDHLLLKNASLTRYIAFGKSTQAFPVGDRLAILIVSPRPSDLLRLDENTEIDAITEALKELEARHCLTLNELRPPTWDALLTELNRRAYQIVHFDGHGSLARKCSICGAILPLNRALCNCGQPLEGEKITGCLAFERGLRDDRSDLVMAEHISNAFARHQVRLIVASACRSTMVRGESLFNSLGPRLIQCGVPAVMGMQFQAPMESTVPFMKAFYEGLGSGKTLVECASNGRFMLSRRNTWFIPTLYLRNQDGQGRLFSFQDSPHLPGELLGEKAYGVRVFLRPLKAPALDWWALRPQDAVPYLFLDPYTLQDKLVFFGREAESLDLFSEVSRHKMVVMYGQQGVGKSSLVYAGLIPKLLEVNSLVLVLEDCSDPFQSLREAVEYFLPEVGLDSAVDLTSLLQALQRDTGRPLVLVFDELNASQASDKLIRQLSDCLKTDFGLHVCLLLVVSDLSQLSEMKPALPEIFQNIFTLDLLEKQPALQAITNPLEHGQKLLVFDDDFLQKTLLPDLYAEPGGEKISPSHLQIVCHTLYEKAIQMGTKIINSALYASAGSGIILKQHLENILIYNFPQPDDRKFARELLQQMVDSSGKRIYIRPNQAALLLETNPDVVHGYLRLLEEKRIITRRAGLLASDEYSFSHHLLAKVVLDWRDPQHALELCAQDSLDRAWEDWYSKWRLYPVQGEKQLSLNRLGGPIGEARLRQIRLYRPALNIGPAQLCLLLHNAVHSRYDIDYWTEQFNEQPDEPEGRPTQKPDAGFGNQTEKVELALDKNYLFMLAQARDGLALLRQIHDGTGVEEDKQIGAAALGLSPAFTGQKGLARAAVSAPDGCARHTGALALAALGRDELEHSMSTLASTTPTNRPWQHAQALAHIEAAHFQLPQLDFHLHTLVRLWRAAFQLYDARWRLIFEPVISAFATGLGLLVVTAAIYLYAGLYNWGMIFASFLIGSAVAALFGMGRWMADVLFNSSIGRLLGGSLGMGVGSLIFLPFVDQHDWAVNAARLFIDFTLAGTATSIGWELACRGRQNAQISRVMIGAGIACALLFAALETTTLRNPIILLAILLSQKLHTLPSWLQPITLRTVAALVGGVIGACTAGGYTAGHAMWKRWSKPWHS